jgi:hypothetical protein
MYSKKAKRDKNGKIIHQVTGACFVAYGQISYSATARTARAVPCPSEVQPHVTHCTLLRNALQEYQSSDLPNSRIQPDRRWFGNTRVIGQKQLESFREQMSTKVRAALCRRRGALAVLMVLRLP